MDFEDNVVVGSRELDKMSSENDLNGSIWVMQMLIDNNHVSGNDNLREGEPFSTAVYSRV